MDWRASGKLLQRHWRTEYARNRRAIHSSLQHHVEALERENPLLYAIVLANRGDRSRLDSYLEAGKFGPDDMLTLAQYQSGKLSKNPPGRHKSRERRAQSLAEQYYREWRAYNKSQGIRDHGATSHMKDEIVRFVVEDLVPHMQLDIHAVRDFFDRPKIRRN